MPQEVIEITEREIEVIEVVERGPSGPRGPQADINYEVISSSQSVTSRQLIAADTSGGSFTLTLPSNPVAGDAIDIFDYSETFDTFPLTIARNGQPIESLNEDLICNVEGAYFTIIYTGSTRGWQVVPRFGTSGGGGGETVLTTQGDMLYRGVGINTRLPIGSAGQILKVNSGATAPEWGAAPATGVTSVGVSGSDGIEVDSGSPVTGSGTIALGVNAASLRSHINVADGANNYTHPNHSGEVTSSGDGATTIANDVVTNAKLANVATATIKGRATEGTGDPEDLSASQVRTILNVADGAEVNVQPNWTEADSGSDAFILNKPSIPTASSATPSALGVAAAGTSVDFARADHVHAMPSAADVGAAPASGIDPTAITGTAVVDNDARLSDSRTPTSHAASHAVGGSDPLAPSDIGAQSLFTVSSQTINADNYAITALRALNITIRNFYQDGANVRLPDSGTQVGDIIVVRNDPASTYDTFNVQRFQQGPNIWITINTLNKGEQYRYINSGGTAWNVVPVDTHTHAAADITSGTLDISRIPTGTTSSTVCIGDDARLSDARTPTSHTHGNITNDGKIGSTAGLPLKTGTAGAIEAGVFGTGAGEFAEGNHTHAQLHDRSHAITSTSDHTAGNHKVFYSNGSGEIQELALGNSGEVLTSNGATSAPSFAAASGGIGGGTGSTDNAILRADGTGGSTAQGSGLQLDDAVRAFSVTGDASTDVITATGHDYVNGQVIRFVGLAGGSGLSNATNYFVRDAATNEFKVATTSGGAAVNFTTNITSGSAIALQENVTLRVRPAKFAFTADASTDVITATGHTFIEHDPVSFSEVVGGAGLNTGVVYYVRDISGDTFKISTSAGGTATNITTNYTGGNVELVAALVLTTPNMAGFIVGPKPDGTTHGGNIRGQGAIDIQPTRSGNTATRVASGTLSICIGDGLTASNTRAIAIGSNGTIAAGINSLAIGTGNIATARTSIAMGSGALADRSGRVFCHHSNSASGHRQELQFLLTRTTTNDTAVEMWADEGQSARVTIPSGKVMGGIVCVTGSKSDGSAVALYTRQFVIKNVGGTTTLLSSSTIGTDYEDNASTDITVEANDTNDALRVNVTGIAGETWRWTGWVHCTEHFYGT